MIKANQRWLMLAALALVGHAFAPAAARAGAVVAGFDTNTLAANDDGSTGPVALPFSVNFFGSMYSNTYVNNNGNITFTGPLGTYTPFGLQGANTPIIAAFFADIDTRGTGSGLVTYGDGTFEGHTAFGVDYPNVGYFGSHTDKLNNFQLLIVDRSDTGAGNFDIVFNYNQVQFETGDASSGSGGLGGSPARVGYSNGTTDPGSSFELAGSGISGAFLDGGQNSLITHSLGSDVAGRYIFAARNGSVASPEPGSMLLLGLGGVGMCLATRRRRRTAA